MLKQLDVVGYTSIFVGSSFLMDNTNQFYAKKHNGQVEDTK